MKKFIAIFSVAAMLFAFAACGKEEVPEEETTVEDVVENITEEEKTEVITEIVTNDEGETEVVTEIVTVEKEEETKKESEEKTEATNDTTKKESTAPQSKSEIIEYCNVALNKVKSSKAGYSKRAVMKINGNVAGLPQWLTSIFNSDKTTTMAKGKDNKDDFPAAGFEWSSKLRPQDVESATLKVNGTTYEIMIKLGNEKNPAIGTASSHGRVMSVIDAAGAADMVPGLKSVDMLYHDGYVHVKVDSKTGNVTFAELSATADCKANVSLLGEIEAEGIQSTETFTNFVW